MAEVCYLIGRKIKSGSDRSHATNSTKRTVKPSLQKVRVMVNKKPKKVWAPTCALESGGVERVQLDDTWAVQIVNGLLFNKNFSGWDS